MTRPDAVLRWLRENVNRKRAIFSISENDAKEILAYIADLETAAAMDLTGSVRIPPRD